MYFGTRQLIKLDIWDRCIYQDKIILLDVVILLLRYEKGGDDQLTTRNLMELIYLKHKKCF